MVKSFFIDNLLENKVVKCSFPQAAWLPVFSSQLLLSRTLSYTLLLTLSAPWLSVTRFPGFWLFLQVSLNPANLPHLQFLASRFITPFPVCSASRVIKKPESKAKNTCF
jgi:hypothetical protein